MLFLRVGLWIERAVLRLTQVQIPRSLLLSLSAQTQQEDTVALEAQLLCYRVRTILLSERLSSFPNRFYLYAFGAINDGVVVWDKVNSGLRSAMALIRAAASCRS